MRAFMTTEDVRRKARDEMPGGCVLDVFLASIHLGGDMDRAYFEWLASGCDRTSEVLRTMFYDVHHAHRVGKKCVDMFGPPVGHSCMSFVFSFLPDCTDSAEIFIATHLQPIDDDYRHVWPAHCAYLKREWNLTWDGVWRRIGRSTQHGQFQTDVLLTVFPDMWFPVTRCGNVYTMSTPEIIDVVEKYGTPFEFVDGALTELARRGEIPEMFHVKDPDVFDTVCGRGFLANTLRTLPLEPYSRVMQRKARQRHIKAMPVCADTANLILDYI